MKKDHPPMGEAERRLMQFAAALRIEDIPAEVLHEAKRSLVNVFATALAGCGEEAVDIAVRTLAPFSGPHTSTIIGRTESGDAALAAFVNAMSANIFDFDDTHEATIIHPAAPVFPAIFAHAETAPVSGKDALKAFVIGGEVECRIGNALSPYHYAHGWHITSTCGAFGAAAATGVLMGLDAGRMSHAISIAAAQSSGLVDTLGTMAKSVSVGGAARNGLISARLAANHFSGPTDPLTGARGYLSVYGDAPRAEALDMALGETWEIAANTYKPYPVGVVLNPVIDAFLALRQEEGLTRETVESIELTGHPLLRERTDRPGVATGRQSQVSAQHAAAIVLDRGRAGLDEFSDAAVQETLRTGRPAIRFHDDPARDIASAVVLVHTLDGRTLRKETGAALGSRANPLSDAQLEAKLETLSGHAGEFRAYKRLADMIWSIEDLEDASGIIGLTARGARTP